MVCSYDIFKIQKMDGWMDGLFIVLFFVLFSLVVSLIIWKNSSTYKIILVDSQALL